MHSHSLLVIHLCRFRILCWDCFHILRRVKHWEVWRWCVVHRSQLCFVNLQWVDFSLCCWILYSCPAWLDGRIHFLLLLICLVFRLLAMVVFVPSVYLWFCWAYMLQGSFVGRKAFEVVLICHTLLLFSCSQFLPCCYIICRFVHVFYLVHIL